jgi:hypothetical protein
MKTLLPGLLLLLVLAGPFTGCRAQRASFLDADTRDRLSKLPYPDDAEYGPDLNIVVTKSRLNLLLSNREPHTYQDREIWLNRQYVWEADEISIGGGNRYTLTNFINEHGEPFPTPGFLRPDKGAPVVLAELYNPQTRIRNRLLVQTIEDRPVGIEGQD